MPATLRPLDPPHRGLRNALSQVSLLAGSASSAADVARLRSRFADAARLLRDHAATEEKWILNPLADRVPHLVAAGADDDHAALEAELDALEAKLEALDPETAAADPAVSGLDAFAAAMAEYHGTYLLHMAHEEATIEKHMMEHFTDAELVQHQIGIMGEMSPDTLLLWFRYIVPARRTAENAAVLAAFRAAAPPAVYEAAIKVIAEEIGQDRTQELEKAVAAVEAPAA